MRWKALKSWFSFRERAHDEQVYDRRGFQLINCLSCSSCFSRTWGRKFEPGSLPKLKLEHVLIILQSLLNLFDETLRFTFVSQVFVKEERTKWCMYLEWHLLIIWKSSSVSKKVNFWLELKLSFANFIKEIYHSLTEFGTNFNGYDKYWLPIFRKLLASCNKLRNQ